MAHLARVLFFLASRICAGLLALQAMGGVATAQLPQRLPGTDAPIINEASPARIPGRYIVVFQPDTVPDVVVAAEDRIKALGGIVVLNYTAGTPSFVFKVPSDDMNAALALQELRARQDVRYIEADQKATFQGAQMNPPLGLDRIDQRLLGKPPTPPLDGQYRYTASGIGVDVYVIDSGIWVEHKDFEERATSDYSVTDTDLDDCAGHGTHVAGIIGGATFGIAKNVSLHSIRIADESCSLNAGTVQDGVKRVTELHLKKLLASVVSGTPPPRSVANLSLEVSTLGSVALEEEIKKSIKAGVIYVIAAGNDNSDACGISPAKIADAITVGAIDPMTDQRSDFSNWGKCVDIFAPGQDIESAQPDKGPHETCSTKSTMPGAKSQMCFGTSQAAPHVAGCVALHLENSLKDTPPQVWKRLLEVADVKDVPGMPNTKGFLGIASSDDKGTVRQINIHHPGTPNVLLHCGAHNDLKDD